MSTQITTAFVQQFSANVQMLSQQKGSLLRRAVREESVTGEKAFFDQVGSAVAQKKTSRHGDTPLAETPHSRRMVTMDHWEYADLIDDADKVAMLIDPTSSYANAAAYAVGRAMDDAILTALDGDAKTGKSGSTTTSLPAGQKVAVGSPATGLTIAKLVSAKKVLDQNNVDPSIKRYIAVHPEQIEDLLNDSTVTSADFNTVKALVQGEINTFMGFEFITSTRLNTNASSQRQVLAWAEDGLTLAVGKDLMTQITQRADKSYSTQVYVCAQFGATRMEEEKVVQILCSE